MNTDLIALFGGLTAIITAILGYYFNKKNQIVFQERQIKEKYYLDYINAISFNVISSDLKEAKDKLSDIHNKLLLIGSSEVVDSLEKFHKYLQSEKRDKKSDYKRHDELLTKLLISMRKDLYNSKFNKNYPSEIHLIGNRPREK